jgi:hypothetical protein
MATQFLSLHVEADITKVTGYRLDGQDSILQEQKLSSST